MVLEKLGESLSSVVRRITLAGVVDERLVKEVVKEVQRALLSSDVNVKLVMELSKRIEERSLKEKPKAGLGKKEQVLTVLYEELSQLLGRKREFLPGKSRIMLVGLQGSGKTTTIAKLAKFFAKRGLKPAIIAADTYRPAAYEQIAQLVEPLNIRVHGDPSSNDAIAVLQAGMKAVEKSDVIILDTAGRHKSEQELFEEMKKLAAIFNPDEKFLIIDANLGQQAGAQARAFHDAIGITGVILTKLDGSAKGGGALSAVAVTGSPVLFVGAGEKIDDLELFDPKRFISRLLGMGDLASLMEKAKETIEEEKVKDILKGEFDLDDLKEQLLALRKLGPLSSVLKMIPGMSLSLPEGASELTEAKMKKFTIIIDSMTKQERGNPKLLNASRMRRIARGSGTKLEEVKELIKYYETMKHALKSLKKGRFARGPLAKMMRGMR